MQLSINQSFKQYKCWLLENSEVAGPAYLRFQFCDVESQIMVSRTCHAGLEIIRKSAFEIAKFMTSSIECAGPNIFKKPYRQIVKTRQFLINLKIYKQPQFNSLKILTINTRSTERNRDYIENLCNILATALNSFNSLKELKILSSTRDSVGYVIPFCPIMNLLVKTPNLNNLNISHDILDESFFYKCLSEKKSLTQLSLTIHSNLHTLKNNQLTDCKSLKSLSLSGFNITDEWTEEFVKKVKLEKLVLKECRTISRLGIQTLITPDLRMLHLDIPQPLDEGISHEIVKRSPFLENCDLTVKFPISNDFLASFLNLSDLIILEIESPDFAADLQEELVQKLAHNFKRKIEVQKLDFDNCYLCLITDKMKEGAFDKKFDAFVEGANVSFLKDAEVIPKSDEEEKKEDC